MNKLTKVLISVFVIVSTLILASIYFVSTKLNSETIREVLVKTIEDNLYQTKATISEVDYSLGTSVQISVNDLKVASTQDKSKLLEFSQLKIQIPILAILTRGGVIDIVTNSPQLYLSKKGEFTNWQMALNQNLKKDTDQSNKRKKKRTEKIELPSFVNKSKINLKVLDAQLFLNLDQQSKGTFKLDRLILKNINLVSTTAFEISSLIQYQISPESVFKSEIQVIGEMALNEFIEKSNLSSSMQFKVAKTSLSNLAFQIPMLRGKIQTQGSLDKLELALSGQLESTMDIEAVLRYTPEVISLDNLSLSINNKNALKNFAPEVYSSLTGLDFNNSKTDLKGAIEIKPDPLAIRPKLSLALSQNKTVDYTFKGLKLAQTLTGSFVDQALQLNINTQALEGSIDTVINMQIDLSQMETDITKMKPIAIESNAQGLKLPKNKIQEILWEGESKKTESQPQVGEGDAQTPRSEEPTQLPKVLLTLKGNQIFIGDQEISYEAKVLAHKTSVSGKPIQLNYGSGVIKPQFTYTMQKNSGFSADFGVDFNKVEVTAFNAFFPPYLSNLKGNFQGRVKGKVSKGVHQLKYNIDADLIGKDGDLDKLNIAAILNPILNKVEILKGKLPPENNISTKFEKLQVKTNVNPDWIELKSLNMTGHKNISKLEVRGDISMKDQLSKLTGNLYTSQSAPEIKKLTGQTEIPFRLTGEGFAIYNPDIGYTTKKLLSYAGDKLKQDAAKSLSREKKKVEKEIKKKIESEVEKQKKKLEESLKDKLKGFKL